MAADAETMMTDDTDVVRGVLFARSIRSSFATLSLYPVQPSNQHLLEDKVVPIFVRIQFGRKPTDRQHDDKNQSQEVDGNGANCVPYLRSHVRRFCKMGDLIRIAGAQKETAAVDKNGNKSIGENPEVGSWQQFVDRVVLTVETLDAAERFIQVDQPRHWNIKELQACQARYTVPSSSCSKTKDKRSTNKNKSQSHVPTKNGANPSSAEVDCHHIGNGHNTSLAKRTQASCVANFLMHAIARDLHNRSNQQSMDNTALCPIQEWATRPVSHDVASVQCVLQQGSGVLDIAGGSGFLAMALSVRGIRATVVDPRPNVGKLPKRDRKLFRRARPLIPGNDIDEPNETTTTNEMNMNKEKKAWKDLLFPALSSPKAPPLTAFSQKDEQIPETNKQQVSSEDNHEKPTTDQDAQSSTDDQSVPISNSLDNAAFSSFSEENMAQYYCQPVKEYDSYRAWLGSLPPQLKENMKDPNNDTLPVCDLEDPRLQQASALVALHPDEATDHMVDLAVALEIPFCIVPCCVFSRLFTNRRLPPTQHSSNANKNDNPDGLVRTRADLLDYLQAKHPTIQRAVLPFEGANTILWSTFGLKRNRNAATA